MKKIQWGISTIGCPDLSLQEAAALGEIAGYPVLEVRVMNEAFPEKQFLKDLALQKHCMILGTSFGLINRNVETLDALKQHCELASECGVPYLRIFGGRGFTGELSVPELENAVLNLKDFEEWHFPVRLALETHDCFSSGKRICRLFESLNCRLPVIWDAFHTFFTGGESLQETWTMLQKEIIDVHVKDGSPSGMTLPGEGIFPLMELFQLLKSENYSGMVTCEHEKMWHRELPELPEVLKSLEPFKKILD